jgi:hypothetical protein
MAGWLYNLLHGSLPGSGFLGRAATASGPAALLSGTDAVALLPAATAAADGKMTAAQFASLFTPSGRPRSSGQVLSATFTASTETTFQDITGLTFAIDASETVIISGELFLTTTALVDYKLSVNGPASPASVMVDFWHFGGPYTSTAIVAHNVIQAYGDATAFDSTADSDRVVNFAGTIINGSTAGTIALQIAKRVAGSADHPDVNAGSFLKITRV